MGFIELGRTGRIFQTMTRYLVTGATGNLGGLTVEALLKTVSARDVSIMTRDPEKAAALKARGVTIVTGDYFDYDSLVKAFTGVDRLLLIGAVSLSNRAPQHENMIKAVKAAKPGYVVYVGFYHKDGSSIKLREVTDVEIKSEKDLAASGVDYTIVKNPLYAHAFKFLLGGDVKEDGVRGFGSQKLATYANIADLGKANAKLLNQGGHKGETLLLNSGESLTLKDMAGLWSEVYGQPVPYIHGTKQAFVDALVAKGLALEQAEYAAAFINAVEEGEFSDTSGSLEALLGRRPVSFKETYAASP
jgi:NAD(P)H dehydrogenase (quinone)